MNTKAEFGFYPIVPDALWVERLLSWGVKTIQLRIKDIPADERRAQIRASIEASRDYDCQLIINDFWQDAIEFGATWVHLGQDDLAGADRAAIAEAGLKLGVSTHSHGELSQALAHNPDYVALGPVYETTLKKMPWAPQGLERLREWKQKSPCPLVAIGGITLERAPVVLDTGADSIAVVSDVVNHPTPEARVKSWLSLFAEHQVTS